MGKKATHSCTLCLGSTCPLCGEKCLRFEAPVLTCHVCMCAYVCVYIGVYECAYDMRMYSV